MCRENKKSYWDAPDNIENAHRDDNSLFSEDVANTLQFVLTISECPGKVHRRSEKKRWE